MKQQPRVIFMGTPQFATAILHQLYNMPVDVVAVFTQPDRPVGRKKILTAPPIKVLAKQHKTPVYQPAKIKDDIAILKELSPDVILTCAYGQFLPASVLAIPLFGCLNIHASLLPKYRGGAPIHWAVINGEKETGISIMDMDVKMDAGAIYAQQAIPIGDDDTTSMVHDKLMDVAARLLKTSLFDILEQRLEKTPQTEALVSYGYNISYEDERIDFNQDGLAVYNKIRGLLDWPVGYVTILGKKVKIYKAKFTQATHQYQPGLIVALDFQKCRISVKGGYIDVLECQIEGKSKQPISALVHGIGKTWINCEVK